MRESSSDTARKMEEKTMSKYREIRNKGSNTGSGTAREGVVEMSGASHIDRKSVFNIELNQGYIETEKKYEREVVCVCVCGGGGQREREKQKKINYNA